MWKPFRCRLFREHDYDLRREPRALFLECRRCGHRSKGWNLSEPRTRRADVSLRLFIGEPGEATGNLRPMRITPELLASFESTDALRLTLAHDDARERPRKAADLPPRQIVIDAPVASS